MTFEWFGCRQFLTTTVVNDKSRLTGFVEQGLITCWTSSLQTLKVVATGEERSAIKETSLFQSYRYKKPEKGKSKEYGGVF